MYYTNITKIKNKIFHKYEINGGIKSSYDMFKPKLYVESQTEQEYHSIEGKPLLKIEMDSMYEGSSYIRNNEHIFPVYGMEFFPAQYIQENYPGVIEYRKPSIVFLDIETLIHNENGKREFPNPLEARNQITAITIYSTKHQKYTIFGLKDFDKNNLVDIDGNDYSKIIKESIEYKKLESEKQLLASFLMELSLINPDIYTGWNSGDKKNKGFDFLYLVQRVKKILGVNYIKWFTPELAKHEKNIDNLIQINDVKDQWGKPSKALNINGVTLYDYMLLYKKFPMPKQKESFTLDFILKDEIGLGKVNYKEYYEDLDDLYNKNHQLYILYNLIDVNGMIRLENKLQILDLLLELTYKAKIQHQDVGSQVRLWDTYIYNKLLQNNVIIPQKKTNKKDEKYAGAAVLEPLIGLFRDIVGYDLDSLYPHLIMGYNIGLETLMTIEQLVFKFGKDSKHVQYLLNNCDNDLRYSIEIDDILKRKLPEQLREALKELNLGMTANGYFWNNNERSFLSELMDLNYSERKNIKKEMIALEAKVEKLKLEKGNEELINKYQGEISALNVMQLGIKIFMNSAYGFLGNEYSRFYDIRLAEGITLSGQVAIKWIIDYLNIKLNKFNKTENENYVIASDTDSIYFTLGSYVNSLNLKTKEEKIEKIIEICDTVIDNSIQEGYDDLRDYVNAYENKMSMKREVICETGFWRSKKNYALLVNNADGYMLSKPKLKIKGLEAIKSNTPEKVRNAIKEVLKIMLTGSEKDVQEFVYNFRLDYDKFSWYDIAIPSSIGDMDKWLISEGYKSGTPIHFKGAMLYNRLIKSLDNKYRKIENGDKIKRLPLVKQNPYGIESTAICFIGEIPKELGIEEYIDREQLFEKTFKKPVESLLDVLKWNFDKGDKNLFDFF